MTYCKLNGLDHLKSTFSLKVYNMLCNCLDGSEKVFDQSGVFKVVFGGRLSSWQEIDCYPLSVCTCCQFAIRVGKQFNEWQSLLDK